MIANVDSSVRRFGRPLRVIKYAISEMLTSTKMGPTRNRYVKSAVSDWQTANEINTTNASRAAIDGSRQLNVFALLRFSVILDSQLQDEIILKCGIYDPARIRCVVCPESVPGKSLSETDAPSDILVQNSGR